MGKMNRKHEQRLLSKWKRIAPVVHDYFALTAEERDMALEAARTHPYTALRCYRAIAGTLKPWLPARSA